MDNVTVMIAVLVMQDIRDQIAMFLRAMVLILQMQQFAMDTEHALLLITANALQTMLQMIALSHIAQELLVMTHQYVLAEEIVLQMINVCAQQDTLDLTVNPSLAIVYQA